jgi:parvulin-like peptidyl-prolyl isomerase
MSKIEISSETFAEAKKRSLYFLNTKFIHSTDELEINEISNKIKNGASFDSLLVMRDEYQLQKNNFYAVHFGQMAEHAEDSLYNLKLYEVSNPIKSPEGYYIFKLFSVENEIIENEIQAKNMEKNIRRVVEARADENQYQKFYKSFFPGKKVTTDGELFWSFSNKLIDKLLQRRALDSIKAGEIVHLSSEDFIHIKKQFSADSLAMTFVQLDNNPISLKQFLYAFAFEGFYSSFTNPSKIRAQLNSRVRIFIEQEFLTREAKENGLQNLQEVKEDIQMYRDNYLSTLYKQTLFDSSRVSDKEVENYFLESKGKPTNQILVNIIAINSDNLDKIQSVFNDLDNGIDFSEIAKTNNKAEISTGLVPYTNLGETGRIAKDLTVGEVYGPIETEAGYTVLKLIDKKENFVELPKEFSEIKSQLKREMKAKRLSTKMIDNTVNLANKYGVSVNEKILYNIPVTNYNMLVYRYMGFGGRLLAVPLTPTFIEWVEKWQKSQQDLP